MEKLCERLQASRYFLIIAALFVADGVWPNYRTPSSDPEFTIGKSGEMKSPGGISRPRSPFLSIR
jgi:hypothetical protein